MPDKPPKNCFLFVAKKGGNVSPSKAVPRNLMKEVPLGHPYHKKTRKKSEVINKTD